MAESTKKAILTGAGESFIIPLINGDLNKYAAKKTGMRELMAVGTFTRWHGIEGIENTYESPSIVINSSGTVIFVNKRTIKPLGWL